MSLPFHTIEVVADNEQELGRLFQIEYLSIPPDLKKQIDKRDLFTCQLLIEEFVVGLLPEVKQETQIQRWQTPRYQIKIEVGVKYFSICFNGHRKIFPW